MTVTAFLFILAASSATTSLLTEGVKKFLDEAKLRYASNVVVFVIALLVGCGATAIYYIACDIPGTVLNLICIVLMGIANWLGATIGYDKVKQTISQIVGAK